MANITLRPITQENFRAIIRLKVHPEQENFVANNAVSIAQVYVYPNWQPWAIYADEEPVGFTLLGDDENPERMWIIRFMIGATYQGKGYGRKALETTINYLQEQPKIKQIRLSYVPGNAIAEDLYRKVGFMPTGEVDEGEIVMALG